MFAILWFGNRIGGGKNGQVPTYIFPLEIRSAVRNRFPEENTGCKDEEYDKLPGAYHLTLDEMLSVKWPSIPKNCAQCHKK